MNIEPGKQVVDTLLRNETASALRDYAPVLGLSFGPGCVTGSLHRIEEVLRRATQAADKPLAGAAQKTLTAIEARERVNGTPWETQNPQGFGELTANAGSEVTRLYELVTRKK